MAFGGMKEMFEEAKAMLSEPYASFKLITTSLHLTLPPRALGNVKGGVVEQLSNRLRLYNERLKGMVVAYSNVRIQQPYGVLMTSQPDIHFNVIAEFIVFQPERGSLLKATVTKTERSSVGCLVHGSFNASFPVDPEDEAMRQHYEVGDDVIIEVTDVLATRDGIVSIKAKPANCREKRSKKGKKRQYTEVESDDSELDSTPVQLPPAKKRRRGDSAMIPRATSTPFVSEQAPVHNSSDLDCTALDSSSVKRKKKRKIKEETNSHDETDDGDDSVNTRGSKHKKKKSKRLLSSDDEHSIVIPKVEDGSSYNTHSSKKKKKKDRDRNLSQEVMRLTFEDEETSRTKSKHKSKKKEKSRDSMDLGVFSVEMSDSSGSVRTLDSEVAPVTPSAKKEKKKKKHRHTED